LKGEQWILAIQKQRDNIEFIKEQMVDNGIDIEVYKKKKLLHIYQILNPMNHPEREIYELHRL
jgi:hypothetical protein